MGAAQVADKMRTQGVESNDQAELVFAQALLVVYHSSLATTDKERLAAAVKLVEKAIHETGIFMSLHLIRDIAKIARRIQSSARKSRPRLHDVLIGWTLRRSAMAGWDNYKAGSGYLQKFD